MTQHMAGKGLTLYGNKGAGAKLQKLNWLHMRRVVEPKNPDSLTPNQNKADL